MGSRAVGQRPGRGGAPDTGVKSERGRRGAPAPKLSYPERVVFRVVDPVSSTPVDIAVVFRILRFVMERKEATVTDIVKNVHISFASAKRYIDFLNDRGLVRVEVHGRKKVVRLTEKGYELLVALSRVYGLLSIPIE